jgi:Ala-tRNA(Pro) deacylase
MQVERWLQQQGATFEVLEHEPTFSAQEMAQAVHVSGDNVAKTVLLKADGRFILAVVPATYYIHFELACEALGAQHVELARELDCARVFPDCEIGALPPFGSQYGVETLVDYALTEDDEIVFVGNDHRQSIRMKYRLYAELEQPRVSVFSFHEGRMHL